MAARPSLPTKPEVQAPRAPRPPPAARHRAHQPHGWSKRMIDCVGVLFACYSCFMSLEKCAHRLALFGQRVSSRCAHAGQMLSPCQKNERGCLASLHGYKLYSARQLSTRLGTLRCLAGGTRHARAWPHALSRTDSTSRHAPTPRRAGPTALYSLPSPVYATPRASHVYHVHFVACTCTSR